MEVKYVKVSQLKKGSYVVIDGVPCKVLDIETSKPGKHGSAKARITAIGLFDNQKRNLLKPTTDTVEQPIVRRGPGQILAIVGDKLQMMDLENYQTYEIDIPKDVPDLNPGDTVEFIQVDSNVRIVRKR